MYEERGAASEWDLSVDTVVEAAVYLSLQSGGRWARSGQVVSVATWKAAQLWQVRMTSSIYQLEHAIKNIDCWTPTSFLPPPSSPLLPPTRACEGHCSYSELLLLIAIHLRERQLDQIEELITSTLQMKVSVSQRTPFSHVWLSPKSHELPKLDVQTFTFLEGNCSNTIWLWMENVSISSFENLQTMPWPSSLWPRRNLCYCSSS